MGFLSGIFKRMLGGDQITAPKADEKADIPACSSEGYAFLDLETPNRRNDSICSIAVIETDDKGVIKQEFSTLINPESEFDPLNSQIHGIVAHHVRNAPTLKEIWPALINVIADNTIVAHNSNFDMGVLKKALRLYGLRPLNNKVICTVRFARTVIPVSNSTKLDNLCERFDIPLQAHHDARCDALACKELFWKLVSLYGRVPTEQDLQEPSRKEAVHTKRVSHQPLSKTKQIAALKDLMEKAIADNEVSIKEAREIVSLIDGSDDMLKDASLKPIKDLLDRSLENGEVDASESRQLVKAFRRIVDPLSDDDGSVEFEGKLFVLTGDFEYGTKPEVERHIAERGGQVHPGIVKRCDYVVLGNLGSELWSFGNYGTKVKKAIGFQNKGMPMKIVSETTLFSN